ncbi:MAG: DNA repair protein [Clostridiales bacterium]|nr:DNA repair protein [Clostridiales bacterium]
MSRTELIEIIYALQQNERALRAENEDLHRRLDDKLLRMERAGSIAEAALSLNNVFEDAERAAQQYLASIQAANGTAEEILAQAQRKADELLAAAQRGAE